MIDVLIGPNGPPQIRGNSREESFVEYQNSKQLLRGEHEIRGNMLDERCVTSPEEGLQNLQTEQLKRPLSSFNYFNRDRFSQIHKEDPTKSSTTVFKEVGYPKGYKITV